MGVVDLSACAVEVLVLLSVLRDWDLRALPDQSRCDSGAKQPWVGLRYRVRDSAATGSRPGPTKGWTTAAVCQDWDLWALPYLEGCGVPFRGQWPFCAE